MQEEVLGLFLRLCKDETPLVRRLAAQHLEAWASLLADAPTKQKELIAAFKNFINDDQVRPTYRTPAFCCALSFPTISIDL